jgi:hypothetical protein
VEMSQHKKKVAESASNVFIEYFSKAGYTKKIKNGISLFGNKI